MPEISVKDQLRKLVELQKLDAQIFEKKRDLIDKPAEVEQLKILFEDMKTKLSALEEKLKKILLARKERELELKQKEEQITKANASLNEVKTNKEYTAKLNEIESAKADKSISEERILQLFDDADAVNKEIEQEKKVVTEEEKRYTERKRIVEGDVKLIEDRIKVLTSQRRQITPGIDAAILSRYEAILQNKDGLALVPVSNNSCGGCFMNLRPQNINAIKMSQDFIQCEYCSRIIYMEDDLS